MSQLVDEYFKRDLTDDEEQKLAEWLDAHPEDSARFAQVMKSLYLESGLPQPVWPHPPAPGWNLARILHWALPLAALLSAYLFYEWRSKPAEISLPPSAPSLQTAPFPVVKIAVKKKSPVVPIISPIPAPPPPEKQYQQLSVVVHMPQGGLATVRVVDSQNNEVKILFAGILPAGQRTFTWDGKTEKGFVAPPGRYFLEIKSGEDVLRREIHLESEPTP